MADRLLPLRHSHEASDLEAEMKDLFIKVWTDSLAATADDINVYGAPHLGSFALVERCTDRDGLAVLRETTEARIRYLFRGWRHRNPERGLHFLRLYLRALFGDAFSVEQLWQRKSAAYPTDLVTTAQAESEPGAPFFLTSRVRVDVDSEIVPAKILASMRSAVAARILLSVRIGRTMQVSVGVAPAYYGWSVFRIGTYSTIPTPMDGAYVLTEDRERVLTESGLRLRLEGLRIVGMLQDASAGAAYEGHLTIGNANGPCTLVGMSGALPPGSTVTIVGPQVVVAWPVYDGTNGTITLGAINLRVVVQDSVGREETWTGTITVVAADGLVAVNDSGTVANGSAGGVAVPNVLVNDTLNGVAATLATVSLAQVSTTSPKVTLNASNGQVVVAAATPAGSYSVVYRICQLSNPTNCAMATVAVTVGAALIDAVNDSFGPVNNTAGGTTASALGNDTLGGSAAVAGSNVSLTPGTSPHGSLSMGAGGAITVAPGTPAGSYAYPYTICEILNPGNCDTATATVNVTALPRYLLLGATPSVSSAFAYSDDGFAFGTPYVPGGDGYFTASVLPVAAATNVVVGAASTNTRRSTNNAATFTLHPNNVPSGDNYGSVRPLVHGSAVYFPLSGNNGMARSTDGGITTSKVAAGRGVTVIASSGNLIVSLSATNQPMYATDAGVGLTWSALGARLDTQSYAFSPGSTGAGAGFGGVVYFFGKIWGGPYGVSNYVPGYVTTTDGVNFTPHLITTTLVNETVAYAVVRSGMMVGVTNLGHIVYNAGSGWVVVGGAPIGTPNFLESNGGTYVVGAGPVGSKVIMVSSNPASWTTVTNPFTQNLFGLITLRE